MIMKGRGVFFSTIMSTERGMTKKLLVFSFDDRSYALPLSQVERVVHAVDVTPLPQAPEIVLGVIDFQTKILPVFNMRRRFGLMEREVDIHDQFIIASTTKRTVALVVDSAKNVLEYREEQVVRAEQFCSQLQQIDGVVQLEDGMVLIHDLERFLALDEETMLKSAMKEHGSYGG